MDLKVVSKRKRYFGVSIFLFLVSIFSFLGFNLNLGIDMTGWAQIEYTFDGEWNIEQYKKVASEAEKRLEKDEDIINSIDVYKITWENKFVVVAGFDSSFEEKKLEEFKTQFKEDLTNTYASMSSEKITFSKYTNIGKSFGDYIKDTAFKTLVIAIVAIALYIAYAFNGQVAGIPAMSFALITVITLFHDVFISSGLYIMTSNFLPEFKIDTYFITALLTTLGYSINDTIVVLDRIRTNLRTFGGRTKNLDEIVNMSVSETLTRSIYTSLTVIFVLVSILILGPVTIKWFVLVMIFGTIVGTFSSIFIASPLLYEFNKNRKLMKFVEEKDDKKEENTRYVV